MIKLDFTLELLSDAEIGTGLGTEAVDNMVPRDERGAPVVPATHLKGLMRESLEDLLAPSVPQDKLTPALFGMVGNDSFDGESSKIKISDAGLSSRVAASNVRTITRTALRESGTVELSSLRTVEAVCAGQQFAGQVVVDACPNSSLDLGTRLALLSVGAIGGERTRGAGSCIVRIQGEDRTPGKLLLELLKKLESNSAEHSTDIPSLGDYSIDQGAEPVLIRLDFAASDPVCCPETPVVGNNIISSGFAIPASAVQGALLSLINRYDPEAASTLFESACFRTWPLLPASLSRENHESLPFPVRVSLTHKISKLPVESGRYIFRDSAIESYDWRDVPRGAPLKSTDGVLLAETDQKVSLWRSSDMPRLFRGHGAHNRPDGDASRGLFTVEAMAPMVFSGLAAIPAGMAEAVIKRINADSDTITFGKAKSVRGRGRLSASLLTDIKEVITGVQEATVFIAQSPVLIPRSWLEQSKVEGGQVVTSMLKEYAWGGRADCPGAGIRYRFGWNRHGKGKRVAQTNRLTAQAVIQPGAVFRLQRPVENLAGALVRGLGGGKEQGFGAVLPHPGIAMRRHPIKPDIPRIASLNEAGKVGYRLWQDSGAETGPSASQVSAVATRIRRDPKEALKYLDQQTKRLPRIWDIWNPVIDSAEELIKQNPALAADAFRVWQDLAVSTEKEERS